MKALVFDLSIPKYLVARALGPKRRRLHYGAGTCFSLREVATPTPHDGRWAQLAPELVGLCGTDLATVFFKISPVMSAMSTTPCVLGHEIVARVSQPPARKTDALGAALKEGDRVVVDPFVGCAARGIPEEAACASCAIGAYATCERGGLGPRKGVMLGAGTELPGGFGERMIAHDTQLFRLDGRIDDDPVAVLVEPLAVAVQAVATHAPREGRALVIGGGPIGLAVVWALNRLAPGVEVTLVSLEDYQLDHARRLGATHVVAPQRDVDILEILALRLGTSVLRPVLGRPFLAGGYDLVLDCVGLPSTLDDALRAARPRGTVVIAGCQGVVKQVDLTFVWSRELRVVGTLAYGWCNDLEGNRRRTFDVTIDLMATDADRLRPMLTHTMPLEQYGKAIEVSLDRRTHRSVKAALRP
jgi:L-iditol 2-dehydrogenase